MVAVGARRGQPPALGAAASLGVSHLAPEPAVAHTETWEPQGKLPPHTAMPCPGAQGTFCLPGVDEDTGKVMDS